MTGKEDSHTSRAVPFVYIASILIGQKQSKGVYALRSIAKVYPVPLRS